MIARYGSLLSAVVLFSLGAVAQDAKFERKLATSDQPDLYVSTGSGDIRVAASGENAITIVGHVHAEHGAGADARDRVQRIAANPPIEQSGNSVHVGEPADRSLFNNISISYEIRVPRRSALNLRSGSGSLTTQDVGRFLAADSGSGDIDAQGVAGPADLKSGSGHVQLSQSGQGSVKLRSGSGDLQIHNLDGAVQARTGSGDVTINGRVVGPGELRTGSGSVRVQLAGDSHFHLNATVGSGSIHTNVPGLPQTGEEGHNLQGDVHGGGQTLMIETGSGDIEIHQ